MNTIGNGLFKGMMIGVVLMTLACVMLGCNTLKNPVQAFYNGSIGGDGYKNALSQMEVIARNSAIVYNPDITDAQFDAWVARHNTTSRRFASALEIYKVFAPANEVDATIELEAIVAEKQLEFEAIVASR